MGKLDRSGLAESVLRLREWWDWTQTELARRARISKTLVRQIERQRADPKLSQLEAIAHALKVDVLMLFDATTPLLEFPDDQKDAFRRKILKGKKKECWRWIGARDRKYGYGKFGVDGQTPYAHRLAYAASAPLPAHWTVDHTCNSRSCVNPHHLRATPVGRNLYERDRRARWKQALQTASEWASERKRHQPVD